MSARDILIIDEGLAVGDAEFQHKSAARLQQLVKSGEAVLMASHDLHAVRTMCHRVVWLDHGRVRAIGPADAVVDSYHAGNGDRTERDGVVMHSSREFLEAIIGRFYAKLHESPSNNYDARRFSWDGVDRSRSFDLGQHRDFFLFVLAEQAALFETYSCLEDTSFQRPVPGHSLVSAARAPPREGAEEQPPILGGVRRDEPAAPDHVRPALHRDVRAALAFRANVIRRTYLDPGLPRPRRPLDIPAQAVSLRARPVRIGPEEDDYVIDGGACFGDTALSFAARVGARGRVFAFDVVRAHLDVIRHNLGQNPNLTPRVRLFECGLSEASNAVPEGAVGTNGDYAPGFSIDRDAPSSVALQSIDDLVERDLIPRVNFIKMDIEGSELSALHGARATLRAHRPRLAISLYHRPSDLVTIPRFLNDLGLGYRLYLDHHTIQSEETVLYAVAA